MKGIKQVCGIIIVGVFLLVNECRALHGYYSRAPASTTTPGTTVETEFEAEESTVASTTTTVQPTTPKPKPKPHYGREHQPEPHWQNPPQHGHRPANAHGPSGGHHGVQQGYMPPAHYGSPGGYMPPNHHGPSNQNMYPNYGQHPQQRGFTQPTRSFTQSPHAPSAGNSAPRMNPPNTLGPPYKQNAMPFGMGPTYNFGQGPMKRQPPKPGQNNNNNKSNNMRMNMPPSFRKPPISGIQMNQMQNKKAAQPTQQKRPKPAIKPPMTKKPTRIGEECPTFRYTVDRNFVEFHTVPGKCKIQVQYPPAGNGPPRVQYLAKVPLK